MVLAATQLKVDLARAGIRGMAATVAQATTTRVRTEAAAAAGAAVVDLHQIILRAAAAVLVFMVKDLAGADQAQAMAAAVDLVDLTDRTAK